MKSPQQHILVIDDNKSIHDDFQKIFDTASATSPDLDHFEAAVFGSSTPDEAQPGFEVDSAFQGKEGLDKVREALQKNRPYPLAFVDVRMPPGWDGIETVSRIWQEYPELQVVICTAYSDYTWDEVVNKLGHPDKLVLLKKPFACNEVLQLAQKLTEKWLHTHHDPDPDSPGEPQI
ncbi:MAG: response regulator [Verrucomicrobiota bacterium]